MAYFLRRTQNHAEAEDLTQEVFIRLANRTTQDVEYGSAYVFQVASNLLKDRSRRYRTKLDYRSTIGAIEAHYVDPLDPFRVAAAKDSIAQMCAALGELNEVTKNVFVLYRLEGMNKAVIADAFGLSVSSIDKHITKATVFLTKRFGEER